ncbi:MAG: response regulator [Gammaproteobacteria bacterium]|nr:response regulator [Gammaproteobacteria bacterium]
MNILVADDHALVRAGLIAALSQLEPEPRVFEAANAAEVMECLATVAELDLILLDLFMPGAVELDLLRQVCSSAGSVPVVVLSASESAAHVRAALELGAAGYVPKSSSSELLISALKLVLAGGVYMPAALMQAAPQPAEAMSARLPQAGELSTLLTGRQQEVLRLLGRGWSNKQIARALAVSDNTVKVHVAAVLRLLGASNRTEAVMLAQQRGFELDGE